MKYNYLKRLQVQTGSLFDITLFPLDVGQVVEGICMSRAEPQRCVVAFFCLGNLALLFECIGQVAICIGEIGLQLDCTTVSIDCKIDKTLFVVDTCQITVDNGIVGRQIEGPQVCCYRSEKEGMNKITLQWRGFTKL